MSIGIVNAHIIIIFRDSKIMFTEITLLSASITVFHEPNEGIEPSFSLYKGEVIIHYTSPA
jgi:hypothetical protein